MTSKHVVNMWLRTFHMGKDRADRDIAGIKIRSGQEVVNILAGAR
jgi:hypothetical protein